VVGAGDGHTGSKRIRSEPRFAGTVRRDAEPAGNVHEMQRDLAGVGSELRPLREPSEMSAATEAHDRRTRASCKRDPVLDRVASDDLAEAEAAVKHR
jgi:hypothetical protein